LAYQPAVSSTFLSKQISHWQPAVGKNNLIMNNPDLILRESILTKNDAITQQNEQATC
jgi:hypothetical protein